MPTARPWILHSCPWANLRCLAPSAKPPSLPRPLLRSPALAFPPAPRNVFATLPHSQGLGTRGCEDCGGQALPPCYCWCESACLSHTGPTSEGPCVLRTGHQQCSPPGENALHAHGAQCGPREGADGWAWVMAEAFQSGGPSSFQSSSCAHHLPHCLFLKALLSESSSPPCMRESWVTGFGSTQVG